METKFYEKQKRSVLFDGEREIGECTFEIQDGVWILNHTFVDKEYSGKGLAEVLVNSLADEARKSGKKIRPTCSYAMGLFEKYPEKYSDVHKK